VEVLEILKVLRDILMSGVEKVILGSAAIKDKNFLKEACENFPNKIALRV
jgi:phosphoribosylformimino-5-aminoimidazole carboxamide ribonucleotide (ProFAR) isomerase